MGIFTRFRDIVSSNLTAILDKAEDPEKMVRLMILEMEDTLIEIKSACAGVIADQKKTERQLDLARSLAADWASKAELAVAKGRDDLARAALGERRRHQAKVDGLENEIVRFKDTVQSFQDDISQLETKLADAREKQRTIIQRQAAAQARHQAQSTIRRADTSEAFMRFEAFEHRIDRMEANANMVDSLRPKKATLRDEFAQLEAGDEIEKELEALKKKAQTS